MSPNQGNMSGSTWSTADLQKYQLRHRFQDCDVLPILQQYFDRGLELPGQLQPLEQVGIGRHAAETDVFHSINEHDMTTFWGALLRFQSADSSTTSPGGARRPFLDDNTWQASLSPRSHHYQNITPQAVPFRGAPISSSPPGWVPTASGPPMTPLNYASPATGDKRIASALKSASSSNTNPSPPSQLTPTPGPRRSERVAQQPVHPGMVSSTGMQVADSSSPATAFLSSQQSAGYIDAETHAQAARAISEDQTVHLLQAFIRTSLHMLQGPGARQLVEVDLEKRRHCGPGFEPVVAIDDGGLLLRRRRDAGFPWDIIANRVAIFETKRKFGLGEEGKLVISDQLLGQTLAEALFTRLEMAKDAGHVFTNREDIIVISAAQQYLCFLSFHIPREYLATYVNAGSPRRLNPNDPNHYITVSTTRIFDLGNVSDRKMVYRHLGALIKWASIL